MATLTKGPEHHTLGECLLSPNLFVYLSPPSSYSLQHEVGVILDSWSCTSLHTCPCHHHVSSFHFQGVSRLCPLPPAAIVPGITTIVRATDFCSASFRPQSLLKFLLWSRCPSHVTFWILDLLGLFSFSQHSRRPLNRQEHYSSGKEPSYPSSLCLNIPLTHCFSDCLM